MSFSTLQLEIDGPVARIWLDRPELRNAFDEVVIRELGRPSPKPARRARCARSCSARAGRPSAPAPT